MLAIAVPASAHAAASVTLGATQPAISQDRAEKIAARDPNAVAAKKEHPDLATVSERQDGGDWQVGFTANGDEIVQVVVDDQTGIVRESWTGYQVAWKMARGYPGAFGRKISAPYVWLPLCLIFVAGLFDRRRLFRLANLDLLVIVAGFGISEFFFNRGDIGLSVPLAYPALLYLLCRALWLGFRGGEGWRPSVPVTWLVVAILFLVGFRAGLNIADSNVIDVGYSGVVGADRIGDGKAIYDNFPENNPRGDTYGPVAYYAYVPFEQIFPWSGNWDDLPAAHAAAIFFDLATIAGLWVLGRRLRPGEAGQKLGVTMAFAWAACPYTAYALESNTNDELVAMLLVAAMLVLASPIKRGVALGLAGMTKFAPLVLAPLFATYVSPDDDGKHETPRIRAAVLFGIAFLATVLVVMTQTIADPGISTFWDRTIGFQAGRDSPFSIWGQTSLGPLHVAVEVLAGVLALLVAFRPRRKDPYIVAALGAAVLIAFEVTVTHWFYLYIPWFFALLVIPMAAGVESRSGATPDRASGSARPSQPALAR
ncbi:MAG: hypothetical protein QOD60_1146 [Solirubrobacterales bacterium]|nr:hypothetical protein [Solirubrobacterales bacterium]